MRPEGNTRRRALALRAALAALLSLAAAAGAQPKRVTFGYSSIGPMASGVWMAKEVGAFEKYGIQAEILFISSGPVVMQALIGGDLQIANGATNAVLNAVLNGAPILGVAGTANRPYHRLFVQPEINRVEDLRGKTLGVTRFGSITDNLTRILLRRYGLEGSVSVRQLGGTLEVGAAFHQRAIAGAVTSELRVPGNVPAKVLLELVHLGIPYSMNLLAVSRDFYRRSPESVEALVRAYAEGVAALHRDKERALRVIARYGRLSEPRSIEQHYQDSITYLERVPRAEPEALYTILDFMGKRDAPLERFVDNSIVDRLVREGFFDRLYRKR